MRPKLTISLTILSILAISALFFITGTYNTPPDEAEQAAVAVVNPRPEPIIKPEPHPEPQPPVIHRAKIAAVGDIMLHEWQFNDAFNPETGRREFDPKFGYIARYIQNADFAMGNLETTFSGTERGYAFFPLFNAPDSFGHAIKNAGFDFLTTANNHLNDKREGGLFRTLDFLDELGIAHHGAFRSQEERDNIRLTEINGITFVILGYSYGTNGIPLAQPYQMNLIDDELIRADIAAAKLLNPDFIIISPHMGIEYATVPDELTKRTVRMMLEAGADIVLIHHPHVLQPMEFIDIVNEDGTVRRAFVIYSLGNFVSSQRTLPRERSIILNLYFEKIGDERATLTAVSYVPIWVQFIDAMGRYNIRVLPVYDTLRQINSGADVNLRPQDMAHLQTVLDYITALYGGEPRNLGDGFWEFFVEMPPVG